MRFPHLKFVLACAVLGWPSLAQAAIGLAGWSGSGFSAVDNNVGFEFTTTREVTVTDLGFYDLGADGLTASHEIAIWRTSDQALLVSAMVPSGTAAPLNSGYRYVAVSPTVLTPGIYIVSAVTTGDAWLTNLVAPVMSEPLAYASGRNVFPFETASLVYPNQSIGNNTAPANLQYVEDLGPDLVSNGSFETGPTPGAFVRVSDTAIPGWTIPSSPIDYIGTAWMASDGARSLDLSGDAPGALYQDVPTQPGHFYTVFFDLAGNPSGAPAVKELRVSTPTSSLEFVFDTTGFSPGDMGWQPHSLEFRASDSTSRIRFRSLTPGGFGPAIDNVRVFETGRPLPSTDTDGDGIADAHDKCPEDASPHLYTASDDPSTASFPESSSQARAERTDLRFTRGAVPEGEEGGPDYINCVVDQFGLIGAQGRITHLQDIALIGDRSEGQAQIFASHSQNFGGQVFVLEAPADASPNEEGMPDVGTLDGQGIWHRRLDRDSVEGPYNHPGDLSVVGDIVVVAGQNWDGGPGKTIDAKLFELGFCTGLLEQDAARQFETAFGVYISQGVLVEGDLPVAEPDAVLFYDVSESGFPRYLGKLFIASLPLLPNETREPFDYGDFTGLTANRIGEFVYLEVDGRWYRSTWMSWHSDDWVPLQTQDLPVASARDFVSVKGIEEAIEPWGVGPGDPELSDIAFTACLGFDCFGVIDATLQYEAGVGGSSPETRSFEYETEIVDCALEPTGPNTGRFIKCRAGETDLYVSPSGRMQLAVAEPGFGANNACPELAGAVGGEFQAASQLCSETLLVQSHTNSPVASVTFPGGAPPPPELACEAPRFRTLDLRDAGDRLVTNDSITGLDWLDLTETANLSFDEIQAGAGGWLSDGWRYATAQEVCQLMSGATDGFGIDCASLDPASALSANGAGRPSRFDGLLSMLGSTRNAIGGGDAFGPEGGGLGGEIVIYKSGASIGEPADRAAVRSQVDLGNRFGAPRYALLPCGPDAETGWCAAQGLYDRGDGAPAAASLNRGLAKCNDVDLRQCQEGMIFGYSNEPNQSTCKKCALLNDVELCGFQPCAPDVAYDGVGSFLVRLPEPGSAVLHGAALALLAGLALRQRRR